MHFGVKGHYGPTFAHHSMILFGPRYKGLLDDIYKTGIGAGGFLALPAPPYRDRSEAWRLKAHSTFYVLAPVAHLGKSKARLGRRLLATGDERAAILDELERRMIPGI